MCTCLRLTIEAGTTGEQTIDVDASGTYNGVNYWEYTYDIYTIVIWSADASGNGGDWIYSPTLGSFAGAYGRFTPAVGVDCPIAVLNPNPVLGWTDLLTLANLKTFDTKSCDWNCHQEDRTKDDFGSVKLPKDFVEDDRGLKDCCCVYNVLGDASGDSWKTDVTSAWIKVSDLSDTYVFELLDENDQLTTYTPTTNLFPNDSTAFYTTVRWEDVLTSDGAGCYELRIRYSISGISGSITWGKYKLQPYSIQNALNTARVRAKFNGFQEIEGINFTGADVESSFRFFGYIGNRQPNMETDNIIYNNREMKRVIRENLNSYEIVTEPTDECITKPLLELYLLSENELFISDYNAHNHSYRINDLPVIVSESPAVEYYDFSRKAKVTAVVTDKFKKRRTYY